MRINKNIDLTKLKADLIRPQFNNIFIENNTVYYGNPHFIFKMNLHDLFHDVHNHETEEFEKIMNGVNGCFIPIDTFRNIGKKEFSIVQINEANSIKCGVAHYYINGFLSPIEENTLKMIKRAFERESREEPQEEQKYICIHKIHFFEIFHFQHIFLMNKKNCIESRIIYDLEEPIKAIQMKQYCRISTDEEKERLFN